MARAVWFFFRVLPCACLSVGARRGAVSFLRGRAATAPLVGVVLPSVGGRPVLCVLKRSKD